MLLLSLTSSNLVDFEGKGENQAFISSIFFSLYATMFQKCILFGFILFLKQYSMPLVLQILTNIIYKKNLLFIVIVKRPIYDFT